MLTRCCGTWNKAAESEPQNPLTREFTEKEWQALREFRVCRFCRCSYRCIDSLVSTKIRLPYIFETSSPEKPNKLVPSNLWGVPIDPSNPVGDARVSVVLIKFLRARCSLVSSHSIISGSYQICLQRAQRRECDQHDDINAQVA